jgi:hypothetical protein
LARIDDALVLRKVAMSVGFGIDVVDERLSRSFLGVVQK